MTLPKEIITRIERAVRNGNGGTRKQPVDSLHAIFLEKRHSRLFVSKSQLYRLQENRIATATYETGETHDVRFPPTVLYKMMDLWQDCDKDLCVEINHKVKYTVSYA